VPADERAGNALQYVMFAKHLQEWPLARAAEVEDVLAPDARRLLAIPELRDDVAFCLRQDVFNLVAVLGHDGAIRISI